jgi:hypothetical protein
MSCGNLGQHSSSNATRLPAISQRRLHQTRTNTRYRIEPCIHAAPVINSALMKRLNWPLWIGLLLSIFALFSYPLLFVNWAPTRDFPWANLVLFAIAAVLFVIGVRRAFAPDRRRVSKILAPIVATLGAIVFALFIFTAFIASRWLPASQGAPQVGQKAPDFTLTDTNNNAVKLSNLLAQPINGKPARGTLLIFYRGYW